MDSTIASAPPIRPDVVSVETTARPTPARVPFSDVLAGGARALVQSAQSTVQALPGSPLMALAVRPGAAIIAPSALGSTSAPEGPGGSAVTSTSSAGVTALGTGDGSGTSSDQSMQATMAQDQQMNLYYLQIQEQVNAQNRTFSALSNVMEVEHNTAKTAIGNIH